MIHRTHLDPNPFFICQGWPNVMGLCDSRFVRFQYDFCTVSIHMQRPQDQNEPRKSSV